MICPKCGMPVPDGNKFCGECGAPVGGVPKPDHTETFRDDAGMKPHRKKSNMWIFVVIGVLAVVFMIVAVVIISSLVARRASQEILSEMENEHQIPQPSKDLDPAKLDEAVEAIKDYKSDADIKVDIPDIPDISDFQGFEDYEGAQDMPGTAAGPGEGPMRPDQPGVNDTKYSYTDVTTNGNEITIIPNGGMNGSTVLASGKDLEGLLDYVDSEVLEKGRTINRDFFYDLLATMLVDKDLSSDFERIEKNTVMALAMANNFYNIDVKMNECELDARNAAEYHYHVTEYDKDDIWIVNYQRRTIYFNDGNTEYTSDMFKDENLAVWMTAVEIYYDKL